MSCFFGLVIGQIIGQPSRSSPLVIEKSTTNKNEAISQQEAAMGDVTRALTGDFSRLMPPSMNQRYASRADIYESKIKDACPVQANYYRKKAEACRCAAKGGQNCGSCGGDNGNDHDFSEIIRELPPCSGDINSTVSNLSPQELARQREIQNINSLTNGVTDLIRGLGSSQEDFARQAQGTKEKVAALNGLGRPAAQPRDTNGYMKDAKARNRSMDDSKPGEETDDDEISSSQSKPVTGNTGQIPDAKWNIGQIPDAKQFSLDASGNKVYSNTPIDWKKPNSGWWEVETFPAGPTSRYITNGSDRIYLEGLAKQPSGATVRVKFVVTGSQGPPTTVAVYHQNSSVGGYGQQDRVTKDNPVTFFSSVEIPVGTQTFRVVIQYLTKLPNNDPGTGGKQQKTTYGDGSVLITEPDGSQRMIKPDGSIQYLGNSGSGTYVPVWKTVTEEFNAVGNVTAGNTILLSK